MSVFYEKLCLAAGDGRVRRDEPMAMHTTFRVGGPAAFFAEPEGEDALARVIRLCREEDIPFYILGNGSNLLISDQGYRGVMIRIGDGFSDLAFLPLTAMSLYLSAPARGFSYRALLPGRQRRGLRALSLRPGFRGRWAARW